MGDFKISRTKLVIYQHKTEKGIEWKLNISRATNIQLTFYLQKLGDLQIVKCETFTRINLFQKFIGITLHSCRGEVDELLFVAI